MTNPRRILIVGAGPTGLTAAVELARRGNIPEIIDKRGEASGFSRAVGIMPSSLKILQPSGVSDRLLDEGIKFREARIYRNAKLQSTISLKLSDSEDNFILGLAQDRTEAHLRECFEKIGGKVEYGRELVALDQSSGKVSCEFDDGKTESFDLVLGADGVRSTVRELSGIRFPGYDLPETWSIADVEAANWPNPSAFTVCRLKDQGVVVVAPLEAERYRIVSNTPDALASLPLPINVRKIRREGQFRISVRQVENYSKGRVFLAGDSAHSHSPVGGRGMNLGIADAADLAERMIEGGLEEYSVTRHVVGAEIISGSERARKFITSSNQIVTYLLLAGLWLAEIIPPLRRRIAQRILYGGIRAD